MLHTATGWWIEEAGAPAPRPPLTEPAEADVVVDRRRLPRHVDRLAPARARPGHARRPARARALRSRPERAQRRLRQRLLGPRPRGRRALRRRRPRSGWPRRPTRRSARSASSAGSRRSTRGTARRPQVEISTAAAQDGSWREEIAGPAAPRPRRRSCPSWRPSQVQAICRSPAFRGGAVERTAATVQPARLAFGLREALLRRGVTIHEDTAGDRRRAAARRAASS